MVMAPPSTNDLAILPCLHGCLAFLHRHFPPQSPPSLPLVCLSTVNSSPRPGIAPQSLRSSSQLLHLQGELFPYQGYIWLWQGLILSPLRLPQTSCFTFSLKCFSSGPDNCPQSGDETPASVSPPAEGRSSPTDTPVFPPSSLVLLSSVWFYIFFSSGQAPLYALSWCSASTSVSQGVFLMYLWREMYSTSTYSSSILFSPSSVYSCHLFVISSASVRSLPFLSFIMPIFA